MLAQALPPPPAHVAHEHSWIPHQDAVDLFGFPASQCRICLVWRIQTPLGVFPHSPLIGFYVHGIGRGALPAAAK